MSAANSIRAAREKMESAILLATVQAVDEFRNVTGATPSDIYITVCRRMRIGVAVDDIVLGVAARIEL
jgi:tagatose-1,6-bisphosphate aldolase non-catalytic subunit AgaZ/GatZ